MPIRGPFAHVVLALGLGMMPAALIAAPVPYDPPEETAALRKAPGLETAEANCGACHSADYINTQPRGQAFGKAFWQAEVTKMINVYKAPIAEPDAKAIVDYLTAAYQ